MRASSEVASGGTASLLPGLARGAGRPPSSLAVEAGRQFAPSHKPQAHSPGTKRLPIPHVHPALPLCCRSSADRRVLCPAAHFLMLYSSPRSSCRRARLACRASVAMAPLVTTPHLSSRRGVQRVRRAAMALPAHSWRGAGHSRACSQPASHPQPSPLPSSIPAHERSKGRPPSPEHRTKRPPSSSA